MKKRFQAAAKISRNVALLMETGLYDHRPETGDYSNCIRSNCIRFQLAIKIPFVAETRAGGVYEREVENIEM